MYHRGQPGPPTALFGAPHCDGDNGRPEGEKGGKTKEGKAVADEMRCRGEETKNGQKRRWDTKERAIEGKESMEMRYKERLCIHTCTLPRSFFYTNYA